MAYIEQLFEQHGYLVLFIGLLLDYIALPFPGQTTLIYAGYLSYKDVLHILPSMSLSFLGSAGGLTVTYFVGNKVGMPVVKRFGKWVFLSQRKMAKTKRWFAKYGVALLLMSCFFPGIRQFIGYFSGIVGLPFRTFALYTYTSAFVWVVFFVSLGHLFGTQWQTVIEIIEHHSRLIVFILCGVLAVYFVFRWHGRPNNVAETSGTDHATRSVKSGKK